MATLAAINIVHKRAPSVEDIFLSMQNELNHQRGRADAAEHRCSVLETELNETKRLYHIEQGFHRIASRDRNAVTGDITPVEGAFSWKCGRCNNDILRSFTYCPSCAGHINWNGVVHS